MTMISYHYHDCCHQRSKSYLYRKQQQQYPNHYSSIVLWYCFRFLQVSVLYIITLHMTYRWIHQSAEFYQSKRTTTTTYIPNNVFQPAQPTITTGNTATSSTTTAQQQRSFPKWGVTIEEESTMGISFAPIYNFILSSSPYVKRMSRNDDGDDNESTIPDSSMYYRPTNDHGVLQKTIYGNLPEVLYMIDPAVGTEPRTEPSLVRKTRSIQKQGSIGTPKLYGSNVHRQVHIQLSKQKQSDDIVNKLRHTERMMMHAIDILHDHIISMLVQQAPRKQDDNVKNHNNMCRKSQWPALCESLYPSFSENPATSTTAVPTSTSAGGNGFPFLLWYGDYIGCNYNNWEMAYATTATYSKNDYQRQEPRTDPILHVDMKRHLIPNTQPVSIPLFTVAADATCNHTFPFPNFYQIRNGLHNVSEWDTIMDHNNYIGYPWSTKKLQIVWRGSFTGNLLTLQNNETKSPRWKMMETIHTIESKRRKLQQHQKQEQGYSELFDAIATSVPSGMRKNILDIEMDIGGKDKINSRSKIPFQDFQNYRGILDIDGHSWSGRFSTLLCLNSVILKVDPNYVEYLYAKRHPNKADDDDDGSDDDNYNNSPKAWKHYIPVMADYSNLEEVAEFVVDTKNDQAVQQIIVNANQWCRTNMIQSVIAHDMLDVWDRYVHLLNVNDTNWDHVHWNEHNKKEKIFSIPDVKTSSSSTPSLDMIDLHLIHENQWSSPIVDNDVLQVTKLEDV